MVTYTTIVEIVITDRLLQSQKSALNRTMSVLHKNAINHSLFTLVSL